MTVGAITVTAQALSSRKRHDEPAKEWGLLPGHQWGLPTGHRWGLSHGHGHKHLWSSATSEFALDDHEAMLLREASRTVDQLDDLQAKIIASGPVVVDSSQGISVHPAIGRPGSNASCWRR